MRKAGFIVAAGLAALAAANAWSAERNFTVANFDEIEVSGPFDVVVNVGKGASVRAQGAQKDIDRLKIEVRGNELHIGSRERGWFDWSRTEPVKLWVTVPSLKGAALAGSGDLRIDRVKADRFDGSIAGSGDLTIDELNATAAKLSIAGSGDFTAAGTCRTVTASIAGSGDIKIGNLRCQTLSASIAGSGGITANASQAADLSVMGSGDIVVTGGAKCKSSRMGSGSITCG